MNRILINLTVAIRSGFIKAPVKAADNTGFKGQLAACINHDTLEKLSSIKAPTLVIVGTADRVIKPSSSEVIAGKIPGSKLVKIENGSHVLNMETKGIFNRKVLSFLIDGGNRSN